MNPSMLYQTIKSETAYELRLYHHLFLAKVMVNGPFESAYHLGGKLLMNYLNGNNYKKQMLPHRSMLMLNPHILGWEVSCILPTTLSQIEPPRPVGNSIQFEEMTPRKVAVYSFRGRLTYAAMMRKFDHLKEWAGQTKLPLDQSPRIVVYGNSVLSFLRKNEIHFDLSHNS